MTKLFSPLYWFQSFLVLFSPVLVSLLSTEIGWADIGSLSISSGTIGSSIEINGSGFEATPGKAKLKVGNKSYKLSIDSWSESKIVTQISSAKAGTATVVVIADGGESYESAQTIEIKAPAVYSTTPFEGSKGDLVQLSGQYFGESLAKVKGQVKIGGKKAKIKSWAMGSIEAIVPKGANLYGLSTVQVINKIGKTPQCSKVGSKKLNVISPCYNSKIASEKVSVQMVAKGYSSLEVIDSYGVKKAQSSGGLITVPNVQLFPGKNKLELTAYKNSGGKTKDKLVVIGDFDETGSNPLGSAQLTISPLFAESTPLVATASVVVTGNLTPTAFMVDLDGDGDFDQELPPVSPFSLNFNEAGSYPVTVTVRFSDNTLIKSPVALVSIVPPSVPTGSTIEIGAQIRDLEFNPLTEKLFALTSANDVRIYDIKSATQQNVSLPGVTNSTGLGIDSSDNILVTDKNKHAVFKYLAAKGYQPDQTITPTGSFGSFGSALGQFNTPNDATSALHVLDDHFFVIDQGNKRLSRFDINGGFEVAFTSANSSMNFITPYRIEPAPGGGLAVLDRGWKRVFILAPNGESILTVAGVNVQLSDPVHLSISPRGEYVVSDMGKSQVVFFDLLGNWIRTVGISGGSPLAAVVIDDQNGYRLVVAQNGKTKLLEVPINEDAIGFDPIQTVIKFANFMANDDIANAGQLIHPNKSSKFDQLVNNKKKLADFEKALASLTLPTLIYKEGTESSVSATVNLKSGSKSVEIDLRRLEEMGPWRINSL